MKAFGWLVLAALALGAWYYLLGGGAQLEKYAAESDAAKMSAFVSAFEAENAGRFVSFTDPDYGFTVKYPIGFAADSEPVNGARLSATAMISENLFEIINVMAYDRQFSSFADDGSAAIEGFSLSNRRQIEIGGRAAVMFDSTGVTPLGGGGMYGTLALVDCAYANGTRYVLGVAGAVSAPLSEDLRMMEYVTYSVTC